MWRSLIYSQIFLIIHSMPSDSEIVITNEGHGEVNENKPIILFDDHTERSYVTENTNKMAAAVTTVAPTDAVVNKDGVVFIPSRNKDEVIRQSDYIADQPDTLQDVLAKKKEGQVTHVEMEPANEEIYFLNGKNSDSPSPDERRPSQMDPTLVEEPLDCVHLNCNNTVKAVCGGKIELKEWKYRLFLNDCYYRKVNCQFRFEENRYSKVPLFKCDKIAAHREVPQPAQTSLYMHYLSLKKPRPEPPLSNLHSTWETRRLRFPTRRSSVADMFGQSCSHICPEHCPNDYDPQCAMTASGEKRMFLNHCKMDYNSCLYGIEWHQRPLSDCVGHKQAEVRQNRAFIGWMQRIGVVDGRGRLKLS